MGPTLGLPLQPGLFPCWDLIWIYPAGHTSDCHWFYSTMSKSKREEESGEMVIGFALLFLGLGFLKDSVLGFDSQPGSFVVLQNFSGKGFWSILMFVGIGTLLTMILAIFQCHHGPYSVMVNYGWIPFELAAAIVLGERRNNHYCKYCCCGRERLG